MKILGRMIGVAFTALAAVTITAPAAHAGATKVFVNDTPTTCAEAFAALQGLDPSLDPAPTVTAEIRITSVGDGTYPSTITPIGLDPQEIKVTTAPGNKSFDWEEVTAIPRGIDVVLIKAGNGRTGYIYIPDDFKGFNLSDQNTTQKITEIMFCADDKSESVPVLATCDLDSAALQATCNALNTKVFIYQSPGDDGENLCACPGVTAEICSRDTEICTEDPSEINGSTPLCCTVSTTSGLPLTLKGPPSGVWSVPANGSFCTQYTIDIGGGTLQTVTACF